MVKIVKDIEVLRQASKEATIEEALEIIPKLEEAVSSNENCLGLSAIHLGIAKRVFVLKNDDKLEHYINPRLIEASGEIVYEGEGSLSFPNVRLNTNRFAHFMISSGHIVDGEVREEIAYFYYPETEDEMQRRKDSLIAIAVQHQMDQIDGKILIDYGIAKAKKVGRNEPCPCGSSKKYKKCCGR